MFDDEINNVKSSISSISHLSNKIFKSLCPVIVHFFKNLFSCLYKFLQTQFATNIFLILIIITIIFASVNICNVIKRYSFSGYYIKDSLDSINYSLDNINHNTRKLRYY